MTTSTKSSRDELDLLIARQLRALRPLHRSQPIPAPAADEPDDDALLLHLEGRLDDEAARRLEETLETHPFSRDRLELLREALRDAGFAGSERADPESRAVHADHAVHAVHQTGPARLVFAIKEGADRAMHFLRGTEAPLALGPAALATRGSRLPGGAPGEPLYKFARRFGDCEAVIQVEQVPGGGVDLRLELNSKRGPVTDGRASLRREGRLVESVRIRGGSADFAGIAPHPSYEMEIKREGQLIGEVCLSFLPI